MKDEDSPLDAINDLHDKMEKFMRAHSGYDRAPSGPDESLLAVDERTKGQKG